MGVLVIVGWVLLSILSPLYSFASEPPPILLTPTPSIYSEDITLNVTADPVFSILFRFTDSKDTSFVSYRIPLLLTALPGEERTYEIEYQIFKEKELFQQGFLTYTIDKRPPLPPIPSLSSGEYIENCSVTFQREDGVKVYFAVTSLGSSEKPEWSLWDGKSLQFRAEGAQKEVLLLYYAQDAAGNKSAVGISSYSLIPASPAEDAFLRIVSPTEGRFLNPQTLCIDSRGYEWIRYRIQTGPIQEYRHPVTFEGEGKFTVEVTAKKKYSSSIERKIISFQQEIKTSELPKQGYYSLEEEVILPLGKGKFRYNLEDRPVEDYDPETPERFPLYPLVGHNRYITVRLKPLESSDGGEYRYVVHLRGESPGEVLIQVDTHTVYREAPLLQLKARPGVSIYYTLDGSLPSSSSLLYQGPVPIPLPEQSEGYITIRARAREGERWGAVAEKFIEYDTLPPTIPSPKVSRERPNSFPVIELPFRRDEVVVYEISWGGKDPSIPTIHSPLVRSPLILRCPFGFTGEAKLRLAYKDKAGNLTHYPEVLTFAMDRTPPPVPKIIIENQKVTIEGKGTIYYWVEPNLSSAPSDSNFIKYTGIFELSAPEGVFSSYQIVAYAEDEAGNQSERSKPVQITLDRRIPPDPTAAVPGSKESLPITNTDYVLTFPDPRGDIELFYTFTEDGQEPPEPSLSSLRGQSALRFYGKQGKRIHYRVKVLARYRGALEAGQIREFQFIIDREPPQLPAVSVSSVSNKPVLLQFQPAEASDQVSFKLKALSTGRESPWMNYQHPVLLDTEVETEETFLIQYRVMDDAGNIVPSQASLQVTLDKLSPPTPAIRWDLKEGLIFDAKEGEVYYELTLDGSLPKTPNQTSPKFIRALKLQDLKGHTLSVATRSKDKAGNFSEVAWLVDIPLPNREPPFPPSLQSAPLGKFLILSWEQDSLTRIQGIDPSQGHTLQKRETPWIVPSAPSRELLIQAVNLQGDPSSPIKIRTQPPSEVIPVKLSGGEKSEYNRGIQLRNLEERVILRYEISANNQPPRKVTPLSPGMDRAISLDVLPEETVTFRIQVQNYSKENIPLSPPQEFSVRIDRTPPPPPKLAGVEGGATYAQDVNFSIQGQEGSIWFVLESLEEGKPDPSLPAEGKFKPYEKSLSSSVKEGESRMYWLSAFTRDTAGNISRRIERWSFLVDKQYLYVAEGKGLGGNGSRTSPYTSLEKAIEQALKSSRTRIRVAQGTYRISKPFLINRSLSIFGGFDRSFGSQGAGTTKILLNSGDRNSTFPSYLQIEGGTVLFSQCQIEGQEGLGKSLFSLRDGTLQLEQVEGTVMGGDWFLEQNQGKVRIEGGTIHSIRTRAESLFRIQEGSFQALRSRFSFERT
ncbi:MAG: chitobiase/beta-hexosaminidase C-terminal domain-containing protein, partial [Spirochaetales bacterium]